MQTIDAKVMIWKRRLLSEMDNDLIEIIGG